LLFFLVAFVIRSFKPEFTMPSDLSKISLQVLGIFFGSKASKKIYETKTGKSAEVVLTREETVMGLIKERGKVERKDVMAALKVSDSTAGRLLAEMETKGLVKQVGEHKDAYYVEAKG
jgi:predicted HTH transcriptional regulator